MTLSQQTRPQHLPHQPNHHQIIYHLLVLLWKSLSKSHAGREDTVNQMRTTQTPIQPDAPSKLYAISMSTTYQHLLSLKPSCSTPCVYGQCSRSQKSISLIGSRMIHLDGTCYLLEKVLKNNLETKTILNYLDNPGRKFLEPSLPC